MGRIAIPDVSDVVNVDGVVRYGFNRKVIEFLDRSGAGVESNIIFELTDLRGSNRKNQILIVDGVYDVHGRESLGLHQRRLEIHHDLPLLASIGPRNGRARHPDELDTNRVGCEVEQLLLG